MKIEYDKGECLGVIDGDGDLVVTSGDGCIYITKKGTAYSDGFSIMDLVDTGDCIHKIHKGDKVTITF